MLSLTGNTAPYMLYAYARIQGIRRKAAESLKVSKIPEMTGNDVPTLSSLVFSKPEEVRCLFNNHKDGILVSTFIKFAFRLTLPRAF
jgi:hypothetical protein